MFGYLTACKVQTIGDNDPQIVIYMKVIMPFHKPDRVYTTNITSPGYRTAESLYETLFVIELFHRRVYVINCNQ